MNTRKIVFLTFSFFLFVLIVPHLCAQNSVSMSPSEAAVARQKMVNYSKQFVGKPYVSGGIGPNSFDCSGLIFTISRESIGVQLPRTTKAIYNFCDSIKDNEREAGDLVFFKTTTSGEISHVGLYIGNSQFIHAVSDGPNTGVIVSSLKEAYWKSHYYSTGRYLPASNSDLLADSVKKTNSSQGKKDSQAASSNSDSSTGNSSDGKTSFIKSLVVDASLCFDWSFCTPEYFRLNFRGFDSMIHAKYEGKILQPGLGTYIRYDAGTGNLQFPIVVTLTLNDFFRIFAGPVISFGNPSLPGDSDSKIENSVFPGIIGLSLSTPSVKIGKTSASLIQDIHYTVYNDTGGSALPFYKAFPTGLVFATGIRVTLPLRNVL